MKKNICITVDCVRAVRCEAADEYTDEGIKRFAVELQKKEGDVMDYEYFNTETEANDFVANTAIVTKEESLESLVKHAQKPHS